ncbi:hypothetical protein RJ641_016145, partial [Dillenia turbinata]
SKGTLLLLFTIAFLALLVQIYVGKSITDPESHPVNGTVFDQLFYFNRLYDYQTEIAHQHPTFRLLAPEHSEIYPTDPRNIEHIVKTNFDIFTTIWTETSESSRMTEFLIARRKIPSSDDLTSEIWQDLVMRSALVSKFKVGFSVELNCLVRSSKEGIEVLEAVDVSNALIYWRYVDPLWKLKRFLNLGAEAILKKNLKIIDDVVYEVPGRKQANA